MSHCLCWGGGIPYSHESWSQRPVGVWYLARTYYRCAICRSTNGRCFVFCY